MSLIRFKPSTPRLGLCLALKRPGEALGVVQRAIDLNAEAKFCWHTMASVRLALEEPDDAEAAFRKALALDPDCGLTRRLYGTVLCKLQRIYDGLAQLQKAYDLGDRHAPSSYLRGTILATSGKLKPARDAFKEAAKLDPDEPEYHLAVAQAQVMLDENRAAINALRKALKLAPESLKAHQLMAAALSSEDKPKEALKHCSLAVQYHPDNGIGYFNRANLHLRLGQVDEAFTDFDKALELEPSELRLRLAYAEAAVRSGRGQQRLEALEVKHVENEEDAHTCYDIGAILALIGDGLEQCKEFYKKACDLDPHFLSAPYPALIKEHQKSVAIPLDKPVEIPDDPLERYNFACRLSHSAFMSFYPFLIRSTKFSELNQQGRQMLAGYFGSGAVYLHVLHCAKELQSFLKEEADNKNLYQLIEAYADQFWQKYAKTGDHPPQSAVALWLIQSLFGDVDSSYDDELQLMSYHLGLVLDYLKQIWSGEPLVKELVNWSTLENRFEEFVERHQLDGGSELQVNLDRGTFEVQGEHGTTVRGEVKILGYYLSSGVFISGWSYPQTPKKARPEPALGMAPEYTTPIPYPAAKSQVALYASKLGIEQVFTQEENKDLLLFVGLNNIKTVVLS